MSTQNKTESPANTSLDDKSEATRHATKSSVASSAVVKQHGAEGKSGKPSARSKQPVAHSFTAILALVVSLLLTAGVFYIWQQQATTNQALTQRIEQQQIHINNELKTQSGNLSSIKTNNLALQSEYENLGQDQKQLSQAFRDLLNANRHLKQDWLISEAEYLLNLAGQRLGLMRDVTTAITALKAADRRLRETGNPELLSIRKALAKDINQLESIHQADLSGLSFKLSAMLGDIDNLKLLTPRPDNPRSEGAPEETVDINNWKELPAAMWHEIKKLVVIREHQDPIKPLLAPEQYFFLVQNLKLQLEQARLAMLSGETQIYVERLNTAKNWIEKWFDNSDIKTRNLLAKIDTLLAQDIHPPLPPLKNSFAAFKTYHKNFNLPESVKAELKSPVKKSKNKKSSVVTKPVVPAEKTKAEKPVHKKAEDKKPAAKDPTANKSKNGNIKNKPLSPEQSTPVPL